MKNPTPTEIVTIAVALRGTEFANAAADRRREILADAFWAWRQAREVIDEAPLAEKERLELEESGLLADAQRCDAEAEALRLGDAAGDDIVSWKDSSLWAAVGDGPRGGGDDAGAIADRLHQKFRYRMTQRGRSGEVLPQSKGVQRAIAIEVLRDDGWKPGRKTVVPDGKIVGEPVNSAGVPPQTHRP